MQRSVIAAVDDLFFASKIRATAEQYGVKVGFARSIDLALEAARKIQPALIICDLNSARIDSIQLARQLKTDESLRSIPLIGFFSHVQTELQRNAEQAGFDRVIPRSVFTKSLALILQGST